MVRNALFSSFSSLRTLLTPARARSAPQLALARQLAEGRRVILASNRGPVEFVGSNGGALEPRRGGGGVVTALSAVAKCVPLTWIASPMGKGDRRAAKAAPDGRVPSPFQGEQLDLRFVVTPQEAYDRYYNVLANPLLWFLQHYMWDFSSTPNINAAVYDAWENGYTVVNRAFAQVIAQELAEQRGRPVVLFQDYHLYLAPGYLRELVPDALLQHFIHIPWPAPRYWLILPQVMRLPIFRHLCQNDIVGFQTHRDAHNFLHTCEAYLEGATVDYQEDAVRWQGRTVLVRAYPISIDVAAVQETAASEESQHYQEALKPLQGEQTIVRVDRLEPSKNIVRGLLAFEGLLARYPELAGKVKLWALLVPSRQDLAQYQRYKEEVFSLITHINQRHGNDAWRPVEVFYENNYPQAVAAMTMYDVLLVNVVVDGMNLVAKEGPTVNTRDGVLILSEGAGAYEQLGRYALPVSPTDVEGTIRALYTALTMPAAERQYRAQKLREAIAKEDLTLWLHRQLSDLLALL